MGKLLIASLFMITSNLAWGADSLKSDVNSSSMVSIREYYHSCLRDPDKIKDHNIRVIDCSKLSKEDVFRFKKKMYIVMLNEDKG